MLMFWGGSSSVLWVDIDVGLAHFRPGHLMTMHVAAGAQILLSVSSVATVR